MVAGDELSRLKPLPQRDAHNVALILKHAWLEIVPLQKLIELGAIATGHLSGLRGVASREFQDADKVIALKGFPGRFK